MSPRLHLGLALLVGVGCAGGAVVAPEDVRDTDAVGDTDVPDDTDAPLDTADTDSLTDPDDTDDVVDTATPDAACRVVVPPAPSTLPPRVHFDVFTRATLTGGPGDGLGYMAIGVPDLDGSGYGEVAATFFGGWAAEPCDLVYWPHANQDAMVADLTTKYCGTGILWPTVDAPQSPLYTPYVDYRGLVSMGSLYNHHLAVGYEGASGTWRAFVGGGTLFAVDLPVPPNGNLQDDVTAAFHGRSQWTFPMGHQVGDFDGDGWLDYLNRVNPNSLPLPAYSYPVPSITAAGVIFYNDAPANGVSVSLGPLRDFRDQGIVYDYALIADGPDHQRHSPAPNAVIGDFNGDGRDEVVQQWVPEAGLSNPAERARLGPISGLTYWAEVPPPQPQAVGTLTPPFTDSFNGLSYHEQSLSYAPAWFDVSNNVRLRLTCARAGMIPINLGDLTGDGRDDLLVVAYDYSSVDGEAYLVTDLANAPRQGRNIVDHASAIFVSGHPQRSVVTNVVTVLDDIDNDGHKELAIFDHDRRLIYIFDGPHTGTLRVDQADFWITNTPPISHLDTSADLDGDGRQDLVISSWYPDAGQVHVITWAALNAQTP